MAVVIKINSDKKYKLKDFVPRELEIGEYDDSYRLVDAKTEKSVMVFDPKHIGRGINIEKTDEGVALGLSVPTGKEEITLYYKLVRRACKALGAKQFTRDGQPAAFDEIEKMAELETMLAEASLKEMSEKLHAEENKTVTFFGALNPLTLSAKEIDKAEGSAEGLGKLLHSLQCEPCYYAAPQFFKDPADDSVVGVYSVMPDTKTVMPFEAATPFYMEGDADSWYVYLYISDSELGYVSFADFNANAKKGENYDASHYFCSFTEDELRAMIKDFAAEL